MKKTILICFTVFITIISSILLCGSIVMKLKNDSSKKNDVKVKELESKIKSYEKCAKKSSRININNLTETAYVEGRVTVYSLPALKLEELQQLQECLEKEYND